MEQWKQIVDFPNYEVSNMGNIKSLYSEKLLKPSSNWEGYLMVVLYKDGKGFMKLVHRLVAQAFVENPQEKPTVDHINMNKQDNRAVNLRWQTQKEQLNNEDQNYKTNQYSEKVKEAKKKYYEANKEKLKEKQKVYYKINCEKINERTKEYNKANKERLKEYKRLYYLKHKLN